MKHDDDMRLLQSLSGRAGTSSHMRASLQGLRNLARSIFVDRNARGIPKRDRAELRAEARPFLRHAIKHVRKSRDALVAGNIAMYECERDRARMWRAFALIEFFRPYARRAGVHYDAMPELAALGGKGKAEAFASEHKKRLAELDGLIRGCYVRGERMRVKAWVANFTFSRSMIYARIRSLKSEFPAADRQKHKEAARSSRQSPGGSNAGTSAARSTGGRRRKSKPRA